MKKRKKPQDTPAEQPQTLAQRILERLHELSEPALTEIADTIAPEASADKLEPPRAFHWSLHGANDPAPAGFHLVTYSDGRKETYEPNDAARDGSIYSTIAPPREHEQ